MELSKEMGSPASFFVIALLENAKADMVKVIESVKTAKRKQIPASKSGIEPQDLIKVWNTLDNSQLTAKQISVRLPLLVSAKISALCEMYPNKTKTEIIGDLLAAVLDQFECKHESTTN